jgi:hypothetical protein
MTVLQLLNSAVIDIVQGRSRNVDDNYTWRFALPHAPGNYIVDVGRFAGYGHGIHLDVQPLSQTRLADSSTWFPIPIDFSWIDRALNYLEYLELPPSWLLGLNILYDRYSIAEDLSNTSRLFGAIEDAPIDGPAWFPVDPFIDRF